MSLDQDDYELDNRDLGTTDLVVRVQVNPWDLVKNAVENLGQGFIGGSDILEDLEEYLMEVQNNEDDETTESTNRVARIGDFILYMSVKHNINLLDIMHQQTMKKENP